MDAEEAYVMGTDEALEQAETWTALPQANEVAHVLAAEVRRMQPIEKRAQELATAEGDHVRPTDRQTAQWILTGEKG